MPEPLSVEVRGDAAHPAVVFLHGFMGRGAEWLPVMETLADRFHCLAPDLPGHGASLGLPDRAFTFDGVTEALVALIETTPAGRAAVVGYSMGGRLALYLAAHRAGRVAALCLESANPGLRDPSARAARRALDARCADHMKADFSGFLREWYDQPLFHTLSRHPALREALIRRRLAADPVELARALEGFSPGRQPALWTALARLTMQVLALAGSEDSRYAALLGEMKAVNPQINVELLPGAGHNVHAEAPEQYLRALNTFLTKVRSHHAE